MGLGIEVFFLSAQCSDGDQTDQYKRKEFAVYQLGIERHLESLSAKSSKLLFATPIERNLST